jgi:DNA-nicking Smr family endonuclease
LAELFPSVFSDHHNNDAVGALPDAPAESVQVLSEKDIMELAFRAQDDLRVELVWSNIQVADALKLADDPPQSRNPEQRESTGKTRNHAKKRSKLPEVLQRDTMENANVSASKPSSQPRMSSTAPNAGETLRQHQWQGQHWSVYEQVFARAQAATSSHPFAEIRPDAQQRKLLERIPSGIPTLTIRFLDLRTAMREVEDFVGSARRMGVEFVRVVCGKGIGSETGSVLRPALVHWCALAQNSGLIDWAPEVDAYGEVGALVLELHEPLHF